MKFCGLGQDLSPFPSGKAVLLPGKAPRPRRAGCATLRQAPNVDLANSRAALAVGTVYGDSQILKLAVSLRLDSPVLAAGEALCSAVVGCRRRVAVAGYGMETRPSMLLGMDLLVGQTKDWRF